MLENKPILLEEIADFQINLEIGLMGRRKYHG